MKLDLHLTLLFLGAAAGLALGYVRWSWAGQDMHWRERIGAITSQAEQSPPGGTIVIGDSITEYNLIRELCGRPAINAGIAWARTSDWIADGPRIVKAARPSIVILALGFNDDFSSEWQADYRKLASLTGADFAVGTDDLRKDAFIRKVLPVVPRPPVSIYGPHPNAAGAEMWRRSIDSLCTR